MLQLNNVKNGKYIVFVYIYEDEKLGKRNSTLVVYHEEYVNARKYWYYAGSIGVDSGQAGIFDYDSFRNDSLVNTETKFKLSDKEEGDLWYELCCDKTLYTEEGAGIVPYGAVSRSGIGDGMYDVFTMKENKEIVGIKIEFLFDIKEKHINKTF